MLIALVGAPNKGKSSLFNALTSLNAPVADYPFTTIDPNKGAAFATVACPDKSLGTTCNPRLGTCDNGLRKVPVNIIDVAGLVPGAHQGRGMGNQFLADIAAADAIICVADASGKTDSEGRPATEGYEPKDDVLFIQNELSQWFAKLLERHRDKVGHKEIPELAKLLSGINITDAQIKKAVEKAMVDPHPAAWRQDDLLFIARELLFASKPFVVAANKCDLPGTTEKIAEMREAIPNIPIISTSADSELAMTRAASKGFIGYDGFTITRTQPEYPAAIDGAITKLEGFLKAHKTTGCRELVNTIVFDTLGYIVVFPVEDERKFSDAKGNVLPDAVLLPKGSNPLDLAFKIHTDIGKGYLYALNAKTNQRLGKDVPLTTGDVVKIVSSR